MTTLAGDFYDHQSLLTEDEREIVLRVRSFMETGRLSPLGPLRPP
jgi:hypothetical protein